MKVDEYLGRWRAVRRGLIIALEMLGDDQLAFVPREGLWSLGTVARHIANAEEGWFRYVVTRELPNWPGEYSAREYPTVGSIAALLREVHSRTESYLGSAGSGALDRQVDLPWGEVLTLHDIVWHVLEHEIHHRGEIYLMLGMMGLGAPDV